MVNVTFLVGEMYSDKNCFEVSPVVYIDLENESLQIKHYLNTFGFSSTPSKIFERYVGLILRLVIKLL